MLRPVGLALRARLRQLAQRKRGSAQPQLKERGQLFDGAATPPWKGGECYSIRIYVQSPTGGGERLK